MCITDCSWVSPICSFWVFGALCLNNNQISTMRGAFSSNLKVIIGMYSTHAIGICPHHLPSLILSYRFWLLTSPTLPQSYFNNGDPNLFKLVRWNYRFVPYTLYAVTFACFDFLAPSLDLSYPNGSDTSSLVPFEVNYLLHYIHLFWSHQYLLHLFY